MVNLEELEEMLKNKYPFDTKNPVLTEEEERIYQEGRFKGFGVVSCESATKDCKKCELICKKRNT